MNPTQPPDPHQPRLGDGIHLHARASGEARVHQAARDQHFHYVDGVANQRRTMPGMLVRECPYPGLAAFEPSQTRWFFGRDGLIADLISRLDQRLRAGGIQLVIAPSGAGKSSLLRAGLLPRLDHAALPGSDQWPRLVFTPTANPLQALVAQLAPLIGADATVLAGQLVADPSRYVSRLAHALRERLRGKDPRARVVVVVDQFEEVFIQCASDLQRRIFIEVLTQLADRDAALRDGQEPVGLVVAGIRADFYASCADHPQLRAALQDAPLVVGPMSNSELREAILFPARDVGLDFEPGLVELLLRDINATAGVDRDARYEAGRLPLLAHALRVSWHQRHGSTLTVQGYQRSGGIQHAIATTADQVYDRLDDDGKRLAQSLFLRLVKIGDRTQDTRRQLSRAELTATSFYPLRIATVIDAFTQARLLTQQQDTVEITHDALLYSWPQLRRWIDTDRAGRLIQQELEDAANEWSQHGREPDRLYRGSRLETARTWVARAPHALSPVAAAFLGLSTRHQRRRRRLRTGSISGLIILMVTAVIAAVVAVSNAVEANRQQALALSRQLAAEIGSINKRDPVAARQLAAAAWRVAPTSEAGDQLIALLDQQRGVFIGHTNSVRDVAFSPDEHLLATSSMDGTVRLWDPATRRPARSPITTGIVYRLAFSPDGHQLATGGDDGTVRLWDPLTGQQVGTSLSGHTGAVHAVAFSPDGRLIATGGDDDEEYGIIRLWDPTTHRLIRTIVTDRYLSVNTVAFSPDGRLLATYGINSSHPIQFWDPATGRRVGELHDDATSRTLVRGYTFSPDGHVLATAGSDGTVRLWDPVTGEPVGAPLSGHIGEVMAVAFSPDGHLIASAGADRTVRLWDPTTGRPVGNPLTGHTDQILALAFSPDGHQLVSVGVDRSVRLWDPTIRQPIGAPLAGHTGAVSSLAFSPNGRMLASTSYDHTVRLWDPTTGHPISTPLTNKTNQFHAVTFSPDGHILAAGNNDGTVQLLSPTTGRVVRTLGPDNHTTAYAVAFSPDGRLLASAGYETIQLWDRTTGHPFGTPLTAAHDKSVSAIAFRPDGNTLASGGTDNTIRLWNPAAGQPLGAPLTGHSGPVMSLAYNRDGSTLASAGIDGTVRLWNADLGHRAGTTLTGHTEPVRAVAFSPDGQLLASAGDDQTIRLWDPTTGHPIGMPIRGLTDNVDALSFSPSGHVLAATTGAKIKQLDIELFRDPTASICRDFGPPSQKTWKTFVPDEPMPHICGS